MTAVTSHAEFAAKTPEGRCASALSFRSAFQIGVDLVDDGMFAVCFVCCDRIAITVKPYVDHGAEGTT